MPPQTPAAATEKALSWLSPDFMSAVVGAPVRQVDANALGSGDNFASAMVRVRVTTDGGEDKRLIVKQLPTARVEDFFPIEKAFNQEGHVYADILPRMQGLLDAIGKGSPPLAPRMLHRAVDPDPLLIFEDVSVEGFRMAPRDQGLDEDHLRLVLRSLARWHAAGAVVLDERPELFEDTLRMVCAEHALLIDGMMVSIPLPNVRAARARGVLTNVVHPPKKQFRKKIRKNIKAK
ncbi:uncharacterized protein LOC113206732 [Frankliniella occidentalis]|uniref:Uncharacterized protein LOC113206732 n=1 Tax=Frankliniella occidentalis TaxID=133901 RepID=A0A9C6XW87_FRAOC|nr:uncharacterized protein LOC113206732 [Frankliniella occidentalis]